MTKCVACGKELDESQAYYREDDLDEEKPYCESCGLIYAKDIQSKQKRAALRIEDLPFKNQIERLQAKMFVLGFLSVLSGIAQLFLALLIPFLLIGLVISALISFGIGAFLIFY